MWSVIGFSSQSYGARSCFALWSFNLNCQSVLHHMDMLLYNHLKEMDWCPSAEQVVCTLPHAFKIKHPTTYIIIGALFRNTHWSCVAVFHLEQHNTSKYLVGVTPMVQSVSYHLLTLDLYLTQNFSLFWRTSRWWQTVGSLFATNCRTLELSLTYHLF
jgi:hypothetical protein